MKFSTVTNFDWEFKFDSPGPPGTLGLGAPTVPTIGTATPGGGAVEDPVVSPHRDLLFFRTGCRWSLEAMKLKYYNYI